MDTSEFTGTSTWWQHPLVMNVKYTDGARYVANKAGAHWLLDRIAFSNYKTRFQVWKFTVKDHVGRIVVTDGDHNVIDEIEVEYTDFPEPGVELWFIDNVILVPSEY